MSSDSTDPGLLAVADQIAADRPELGAYSKKLSTGFSESALAIRTGIPGLSFSNRRIDSTQSVPALEHSIGRRTSR